MYLLFPSFKTCLVPPSARLLGLIAFLLVFAQCQPEPVGKPPSSPKSPPPFEQVWWTYLGEKLRDEEFNKRLITADQELLLTTFDINASDPRLLITLSLDSGQVTSERADVIARGDEFLGGKGADYYFTGYHQGLKRFNAQALSMQDIGTYYQSYVYIGSDPRPNSTYQVATIFDDNDRMIDVRELSYFDHEIDYVFFRYDLASGQLLDTHHLPMPGPRLSEPEWSFTPIWTGPDGTPYTVAFRYNKAIWMHAETLEGIDTLRSGNALFRDNFAKNTFYYEDRQTGRLRALRMPGRELLWEGPSMPSGSYRFGRAGEKLLVCQRRNDVYHRRTGDYLWSGFPAYASQSCRNIISADGVLVARSFNPTPDLAAHDLLIRDPATGHVHQTLEGMGFILSFRYDQPSGTLLVFSTKGIYAYRRPK